MSDDSPAELRDIPPKDEPLLLFDTMLSAVILSLCTRDDIG